jgi:hypothetical protein
VTERAAGGQSGFPPRLDEGEDVNLEGIDPDVLEDLTAQHQTYFMTGRLSERLGQAHLTEVVLYAYGVNAGSDEAERARASRGLRLHEGHLDCETSRHFWRGVCEARRAEIGAPLNKKPRKKSSREGSNYARFKVRGGPLLLGRLRDFFELYSEFPDVADDLHDEIERDKGLAQLNGLQAKKAIYCLYHDAKIGLRLDAAAAVLNLQHLSGRGIGFDQWDHQPEKPDLSRLKPVPKNWLR